ncbi:protein YgfX [Haliea sp. E17]|uniref:protein YgfX n=1 Tax=Haliea sp. E17 TaxID=3401576 RepID=UPI003AAFC2F8
MSATFSTSPELRLRIAESRYPRLFFLALAGLQLANLLLLARAGVAPTAIAGLGLAQLLLFTAIARDYSRRRQRLPGLYWRQGQWWIQREGEGRQFIQPLHWHCLPWCTWLAWREEGGGREALWLFADSAPRDGLRRLRVRLTLQRAV